MKQTESGFLIVNSATQIEIGLALSDSHIETPHQMMLNRLRIVSVLLVVLAPLPAPRATAAEMMGEQPAAVAHLAPPAPPLPAVAVAPPLTGKPWRLTELTREPWPGEKEAPYLLFTDAGDLLGFGGCNYFIGKYRRDADEKVVVSSLRASHNLCPEASEAETTLLTSLVLANSLQVGDGELTFSLNGNPLMKLGEAPDLSVAELLQHGKLLKVKKTRKHKTRGKKKKIAGKAKKHPKKTAAQATRKKPKASAKPVQKK